MAVGDLKARLRARFPRRHSITPASTTAESDTAKSRSISKSLRSLTLRSSIQSSADLDPSQLGAKGEEQASQLELPEPLIVEASSAELQSNNPQQQQRPPVTSITVDSLSSSKRTSQFASIESALPENEAVTIQGIDHPVLENIGILEKLDLTSTSSSNTRTSHTQAIPTPGSLFSSQNSGPIETAESIDDRSGLRSAESDYFPSFVSVTGLRNMGTRKIWVKRPHASATLVTVNEEDLVDDVREMILRKYANSLGRNFDAPDLTLRIVLRDARQERTLGPDELMCRTLDAAFPGGQGVDDALLIDVPSRRTPRASPRGGPPAGYYHDEGRPGESGSDYFPPMPIPIAPTPHLPNNVPVSSLIATSPGHHPASNSHAISVLTTGHVPNLPSPGGSRRHHARPRAVRQHTPSPTLIGGHIPSTAVLNNGRQIPLRLS
jgi:osomolarity two-component system response regulator SSK1